MSLKLILKNTDFILKCIKEQFINKDSFILIDGYFEEESRTTIVNYFIYALLSIDRNMPSSKIIEYRYKLKGILKYYKYIDGHFIFCETLDNSNLLSKSLIIDEIIINNLNYNYNKNIFFNFDKKKNKKTNYCI